MSPADYLSWWAVWRKQVQNWATRGIESRKHGELVERLALEESPEFADELARFELSEPDVPLPPNSTEKPKAFEKLVRVRE